MVIDKFENSSVPNQLRHVDRLIGNDSNRDIDPKRTHLNYSLTPYIDIPRSEYQADRDGRKAVQQQELKYYNQRKAEVYVYNRADVKTLASCIVTLPKEITDPAEIERFFSSTAEFLSDRYGGSPTADGRQHPNVISATVHFDERKMGQPHLHFYWIPTVQIDHAALAEKKNHPKAMDDFEEKISAKEVLTKADLQTLHQDLQKHLDEKGIAGRVLIRKEGDGRSLNLSVAQLKEITDRTGVILDRSFSVEALADLIKENAVLRERVAGLERQLDVDRETGWGRVSGWGNTERWGDKEWER